MKTSRQMLEEASKLFLDLWTAGGPQQGGEQYPNMLNVIDMHQRIEAHLSSLPEPSADLASIELRALAMTDPDVRTDRILGALFGGTVTGRMVGPYHPGVRQQRPNGKKMGIGVDEKD